MNRDIRKSIIISSLEKNAKFGGGTLANNFINVGSNPLRTIGTVLLAGAGIEGAGQLLDAGVDAFKNYRLEKQREPLFTEMLQVQPKLKSMPRERVKLYYDQLWHFSPKVATNPPAAAAYVLNAMRFDDQGGTPIPTIKEISAIQKQESEINDASAPGFTSRLMAGGATVMGLSHDEYGSLKERQKATYQATIDNANPKNKNVKKSPAIDPRTGQRIFN